MNAIAGNDSVTALVRRHDPDRFLTALFAPADRRATLLTLYGFNHELARAPEVASQPMLALIRLQWWREVVEGVPKRHEIASPLSEAIAQGELDPADLAAMIEAREREVEDGFDTLEDWQAWLWQGAGSLSVAAARLLGAPAPETFRRFGAAYGGAGLLRSVSILARMQRCPLPLELLTAEGLTVEAAVAAAQAMQGEAGAIPGGGAGASRTGAHRLTAAASTGRPGSAIQVITSGAGVSSGGTTRRAVASKIGEGNVPLLPPFRRDLTDHAALGRVLDRLASEVATWLGEPSRVRPKAAIAAALPAVLARRDLSRIRRGWQPRGFSDRATVAIAGLSGRV